MGVRDVRQQKQTQCTLDAFVFSMAAVERVEESFLTAFALRSAVDIEMNSLEGRGVMKDI